MDVTEELRRRGGIARTRTLIAAGIRDHELRRARAHRVIRRVRKGWVALPDADPALTAAIGSRVVLSCVTVAQRKGLWVPEKSPPHVAAPAHSGRVSVPEGIVVHWATPVLPREPEAGEDSLVNALALIAQCQPRETALIVWESALNRGDIDRSALERLPLPSAARGILDSARPFADSGLETICFHRLKWLGLPMRPQSWIHGHRVDLLVGDRLVIQIDGGHHVGAQRTSDIAHDAQLALRGYCVLRFSYEQIMHRWHEVQATVMEAVAGGLHLAR